MKVVLDTNVWISSLLLPKSISGKIVAAWQKSHFTVITSSPILDEIERVLNYPKIKKRLPVTPEDIAEYITFLRFFTHVIELTSTPILEASLRDISDAPILETLIISEADYLITGDQDLLVLGEKYPIITPKKFTEFLG